MARRQVTCDTPQLTGYPIKFMTGKQLDGPKLILLEHDSRFSVFPEFVFYDFQQPLKLPGDTNPQTSEATKTC